MIIGCDIDGVVIDIIPPLLAEIKKRYGLKVLLSRINNYSIEKCTGLSSEQVDSIIDAVLQREDLPAYEDACRWLAKAQKEHEIIFITSRKLKHYRSTRQCLTNAFARYGLSFDPIEIFYAHGKTFPTKSSYVKSFDVDIFIEDRMKFAKQVAEECLNCRVFLMDRLWNQ